MHLVRLGAGPDLHVQGTLNPGSSAEQLPAVCTPLQAAQRSRRARHGWHLTRHAHAVQGQAGQGALGSVGGADDWQQLSARIRAASDPGLFRHERVSYDQANLAHAPWSMDVLLQSYAAGQQVSLPLPTLRPTPCSLPALLHHLWYSRLEHEQASLAHAPWSMDVLLQS